MTTSTHDRPTPARRGKATRWPRRARGLAALTATALLAGLTVVGPGPTPPAAVAADTRSTARWDNSGIGGTDPRTWTSSLSSTLGIASNVFGFDKSAMWLLGGSALAVAGPLLAAALGSGGPGVSDVLDELDGVEHQLTVVQQSIDKVQTEVESTNVNTLMGTCTAQTARLQSLRGVVETSETLYSRFVAQTKRVGDEASAARMKEAAENFIRVALGSVGQSDVAGTELGRAITQAHLELSSSGGGSGIIDTCGKAYLEEWWSKNASDSARTSMDATAAGAWVDDRAYFERLQAMVVYWQTVMGQGAYLLQQASLLQAALYTAGSLPAGTTAMDAAAPCYLASKAKNAVKALTLCESGAAYMADLSGKIAREWRQVGVPYTDEEVVLALGSGVTRVPRADGSAVPSTLWVRDPTTYPGGSSGPWTQGDLVTTTFRDWTGWKPASATQWSDLSQTYVRTHGSFAAAEVTPRQVWGVQKEAFSSARWNQFEYTKTALGPTAPSSSQMKGTAKFAPVDVLQKMSSVHDTVGAPLFAADSTGTLAWIPTEQTTPWFFWETVQLKEFAPGVQRGLTVAPGELASFRPPTLTTVWAYQREKGLGLRCFVAPQDGVVCGDTVAPWWIARQNVDYRIVSSNWWTHNWTSGMAVDVVPLWSGLGTFRASGTNVDCHNSFGVSCGTPFNVSIEMPEWMQSFQSEARGWQEPPVRAGTLWPALAVPTTAGCTTGWGVPTRCGSAFDHWVTNTLPAAGAAGPQPTSDAWVSSTAPGRVSCNDPSWQRQTSSTGAGLVHRDTRWTAIAPDGSSAELFSPAGTDVALADLVSAGGWTTTPPRLSLVCTLTTAFADAAGTISTLLSSPATAERSGDVWTVVDGRGGIDDPDAPEPTDGPSTTPEPTAPPSAGPVLTPSATPTANPDGGVDSVAGGPLAATGQTVSLIVPVAGGAILALGALLLIGARRRRRTTSR
ncbi:hypothetical protein NS220_13270 [Microbacterium testaceum]|uniref:Gram-positive cocci surface proteins LPxTG domain-containing protein n=1 Tax=Microbacterium testaceum TaxID=2033 RepID=A0A147EV28_MICTE|nr:hypothetical protein [Microbacterium testaceum]KTR93227.1 hypothetical protein NS220_13270 [Microbacterium testaceum]